jgi:hypothetical protein
MLRIVRSLLPILPMLTTFLLVAALTAPGRAQDVYDFESMSAYQFLHGHDNWIDQPGQGQAAIVIDESPVNGTKVVRHVPTVAFHESAFVTRVNDASYGYPPFSGDETGALIEFEVNGEALGLFALGCDLNGDGMLKAADGELGPAFGTFDRAFRLQRAADGASLLAGFNDNGRGGNAGSDWYRMRLTIDFTAYGGNGAGTVHYMNLTDGDPDFELIPELERIDLALGDMHPDAGPAAWNAMWLHVLTSGGNIPHLDNLLPRAGTLTGVADPAGASAPGIGLVRAAPNPFAASTRMRFELEASSLVRLEISDVTGRRIFVSEELRGAGWQSIEWRGHDGSGRRVPSGVYFYRLEAGGSARDGRVLLAR